MNIKGRVFDAETREPISFAKIYFSGISKNIATDFEGVFQITGAKVGDTLLISFYGYIADTILVTSKSAEQELMVEMRRQIESISEVRITSKVNPALKWIGLARDNRQKNNPDNLEFYECETYTKNTIAINKISGKLRNGRLGKEIGPLFDTISYISGDKNTAILPVFVSEVVSNYYYNKKPYLTKEEIVASRLKGVGVVDGSFVSQLLGTTFVGYNFYMNTLTIIDKGISTPISENSNMIYNFKLVDVDKSGPRRIFQILCTPKNKLDLAFTGFVWIEDTTGAMVKLSLELNNSSNLNYIEKLRITQEYAPTKNGSYFCINSRVSVDAAEVSTKAAGIVATSSINYSNINISNPRPSKFFDSRVVMLNNTTNKPDSFWNNKRPTKPNAAELRIDSKLDTLINLPVVKTYVDVVNFLVDGYFNIGKFDKIQLGPYYSMVNYNLWEGLRLRLGFRTSYKLSRNWLIEGMTAYGLKDETWKYSLRADRILNRKRWTKLGVLYRKDVELIGFTDNDDNTQGIFTAFNLLQSRNLTLSTDRRIIFGTDIRNGLRVSLTMSNRNYRFKQIDTFNFAWYPNLPDQNDVQQNFINTIATFSFRYAPRDYFLQNDNRRVNFAGPGMFTYGSFTQGFKGVLNGQFNYQRVLLGLGYNKVWGPIGRTNFVVEGLRIFGLLPYPLLNVYLGNQSFIYNSQAFNQMRIFEFVTDRSISSSFEHHFNGFFLNRIPLIKKLKWREVISGKAILGSLDQRNFDLIPQFIGNTEITQFKTFKPDQPYLEISVGLENVFKLFRIDAIWRLTYREETGARPFGIKASAAVQF